MIYLYKMIGCILCGGSGTRLYPVSNEHTPKQFIKLFGEKTLFQLAIERLLHIGVNKILLVYSPKFEHCVSAQIKIYDFMGEDIFTKIEEPYPRNTGPAILLALHSLTNEIDNDFIVIPSDHLMDNDIFKSCVDEAQHNNGITIFGIKPTYPETGFGYILSDEHGRVKSFTEKPSVEKAFQFLRENYLWNSGCFYGKISTFLKEIQIHCPGQFLCIENNKFSQCQNLPFDKMIMEKTEHAYVVPYNGKWSDMGSWKEVFGSKRENIINTDVSEIHVLTQYPIQVIHSNNIVAVIDSQNNYSAQIKELSSRESSVFQIKPWGNTILLDRTEYSSTKKVSLKPKCRTSLQLHRFRTEHLVFISGQGLVISGTNTRSVGPNDWVDIPGGTLHRIENTSKNEELIFIETQRGLIDEKDLERVEDDYNRS